MVTAPQSPVRLFDTALIRNNRRRSAGTLKDHGFLIDWAGVQLLERLQDVRRSFPVALQIGARTGQDFSTALRETTKADAFFQMDSAQALFQNRQNAVLAEEDFFPFKPGSLDLVIDLFNLHTVNDLPGALIQIRKALKPDGMFIAAMPGGETLHELRAALNHAELEMKGGLSPRVHPFATKQDMGALLQRAGFALPVVDSDIVTVTYETMFKLLSDLRGMGEGNALVERHTQPPGRGFFMNAARHYAEQFSEDDGRIAATFEIIFLIGWAPHESQQKPLRPGSAKARLADALGTNETKV